MSGQNSAKLNFEHPGVIAYIEQLQGIISRMAANSANCKVCAVTILAAVMALSKLNGYSKFWLCLFPTLLMLLADCYYLGLERRFKEICNRFVSEVRAGKDPELFSIPKAGFCTQLAGIWGGLRSISTFPFYALLAIVPLVIIWVENIND